jgi:hypothetical protein
MSIEVVVKKKDPAVFRTAELEIERATRKFGADVDVKVAPPERIEVNVKKDDPRLYREIAERVISSIHQIKDDVAVTERPIFDLSEDDKRGLMAVNVLEQRGERPDIFSIITIAGVDAIKIGLAVQNLLELRLVDKDDAGIFKLTEWGREEAAKIIEKRKGLH